MALEGFGALSGEEALVAEEEGVLFLEVAVLDLEGGVEFVEGLDALPEPDHDVQHQVPVLVAEVDGHLLGGLQLFVLLAVVDVEELELGLHLLELGGAEAALLLRVGAVVLAELHELAGGVEEALELVGHLEAELLATLVLDLLLAVLDLVDAAGLDAVGVVVLVEAADRQLLIRCVAGLR